MAITGVNSATSALIARTDRGLGTMKSEDFFKLLVTELKQQDPFQPAKTGDMINQVSQIRSIELSKQLTDVLGNLTANQQTVGTGELLGKYVTAQLSDADGKPQEVAGVVTGVRFEADGTAILELDNGQTVPAKAVTRIQTADAAAKNTTASTAKSTNATNTGSASPANASATTSATGCTTGNCDKASQTSKVSSGGGLLPWLKLSGAFEL